MRPIVSLMIGASLIGVAMPAVASDRVAAGEEALAKITAGRTVGTPVDCINLRDIRSSEIVPDVGIVYRMNNGTLFVNRPDGGGVLNRDDILVTRTIGTRLCRIDIVNLIDRGGLFPRGSIALNDFVPYSRLERPRG